MTVVKSAFKHFLSLALLGVGVFRSTIFPKLSMNSALLAPISGSSLRKNPGKSDVNKTKSLVPQEVFEQMNRNEDFSIQEIRHLFPEPTGDSVAIYNSSAIERLRSLFSLSVQRNGRGQMEMADTSHNRTKRVRVCANGGSSTAGGGKSGGKQYFRYLQSYFEDSHTELEIIERGHGNRNSLHSSQMAPWYWSQVDVMFWEFSINDAVHSSNSTQKITEERNHLIAWLDQVESRMEPPPLIILIYLWNSPFHYTADNKIASDVFESHQLLAAGYDFVVGHIHLAKYISNDLKWTSHLVEKIFLADVHHPSRLGHGVMAHLLLDLLLNEKRETESNVPSSRAKFEWTCGVDSPEKRFFLDHIAGKTPVGAFTLEVPKHNETSGVDRPGMIRARNESDLQLITFGKANPRRRDRQFGAILPCCEHSSIDLYHPTSIISVQAIQLALLPEGPNQYLRVFLNDINVTSSLTVAPADWDCIWNYKTIYPTVAWILLPNQRVDAQYIRLCSTLCEEQLHASVTPLAVMSVVVY